MDRKALDSLLNLIKVVFTYGIAAYIVVTVLNMLRDLAVAFPDTFGVAAIGIVGATIAGVTAFVFATEQGKQQAVAQQQAYEKGLNTPGPGGTVVQNAEVVEGGDPTLVNREVVG